LRTWPIRITLEATLWVLAAIMTRFGTRAAYWWARRFASVAWTFLPRIRRTAIRNLDLCLPERTPAERRRLARASFNHVAYTFFDALLVPRHCRGDDWRRHISLDATVGPYIDWLKRNEPSCSLSGHFGNWEIGPLVNSRHGRPITCVVRPIDMPMLNRWMQRLRAFTQATVIEKHGALRQLARAIKDREPVMMLLDQNGGDHGFEGEFFGIGARWQADILRLYLKRGLRLTVGFAVRDGDRFHFTYKLPFTCDYPAGTAIETVIADYSRALEAAIRANPEQYFWLHRRFKGLPRGARNRYHNLANRLTRAERDEMVAPSAEPAA
jgi:KDO2-lipid IV(A) lauroyltransferase